MSVYRKRFPAPDSRGRSIVDAARQASLLRQQLKIGMEEPVCPFETAHELKVDVRFVNDISSMEGIYLRNQSPRPLILVSSLRPAGRQRFTAAHELGHHIFKHEGHVLQSSDDENQQVASFMPEEILADAFAAHFLMPKVAIMNAFTKCGIGYDSCTPQDIYRVAWYFGVGYDSLLRHMTTTLRLISKTKATELRRVTPKKIRAELMGRNIVADIIPVDSFWTGSRAVDAQVGDLILLPQGGTVAPDNPNAKILSSDANRTLVETIKPGVTQLFQEGTGWGVHLRVSRRQYVGLARYRFLEDEEYEFDIPDSTN